MLKGTIRRFLTGAVVSLGVSATALALGPEISSPMPADVIYTHGHIYTPGGFVTSMAVANGVIVGVGGPEQMAAHEAPATQTVDLGGATVLPGLHDMHVHPILAAIEQKACPFKPGNTLPEMLATLKKCVDAAPKGGWIVGRAYESSIFGGKAPNKAMLDAVAPDNPVFLNDISGHSGWANSLALAAAHITRDTSNPEGGLIVKDPAGEPTGILHENAAFGMGNVIPAPSREENVRLLKWALDKMVSFGITALEDASTSAAEAQAYADLSDRGELAPRVRACLVAADPKLVANRNLYRRPHFSPTCVKVFLDGVPTHSHTAAMLAPYVHEKGEARTGADEGMLLVTPEKLRAMMVAYDREGLTVKFHSAGDRAVHEVFNAIQATREADGFSGLLHNSGHNSFVAKADIDRARGIAATIEFSPYIWFPSPIMTDIELATGPERMKRFMPVRDALAAGALTVAGSDWPVVPTVNPWIAIETLVTREVPGGGAETIAPGQRITLKDAIDIFTINGAREQNNAALTGALEVGKMADFIVLDRDIFSIPVREVHNTVVKMTYVGGQKVYDSEDKK